MASPSRPYDCFIIGGGLAGLFLAKTLQREGKRALVIDAPGKSRCSLVAAGLINPIAGRRLNLAWKADTLIPFSQAFYQTLEKEYGKRFFHPRPMARLFANDVEQATWEEKSTLPQYARWAGALASIELPEFLDPSVERGFAVRESGYVDLPLLLKTLSHELQQTGQLIEDELRYKDIHSHSEAIQWREFAAPFAIFCEGHLATDNPWFQHIPYKPAKGVIGRVRCDRPLPESAILKSHFLIPRHDGSLHVGATYRWDQFDDEPDAEGIAELERFLNATLGARWEWLALEAGVRPATAGAKPVIGPSADDPRILSFNGFGSKGSTQAPFFAQALHDFLWKNLPLPSDVLPSRFLKPNQASPKRWVAVEIARDRVLERIQKGDTVIDATAGNGHDTLWLAQAAGPEGRVFAFDIQEQAIEATRERLRQNNCLQQASLIHASHAALLENVPSETQASAIVYNLGYLPKGDKRTITRPESTIPALSQSLDLLAPEGILSVVLYPAHEGGSEETQAVLDWAKNLDPRMYQTEIEPHPARLANAPFPVFIQKR